jgi:hypothetical protein
VRRVEPLTPADLAAFGLVGPPQLLPGGSATTYRVGSVVLKHVRETSLENHHSPALAGWLAELTAHLPEDGFRLPRGVPTRDGAWITPGGWTAWTFVAGSHATATDIPACIPAITKLHAALRSVLKHPLLDNSHTPWANAHRWSLGEPPARIHPVLQPYVAALDRLRTPIPHQPYQLIHGDLNPENILIAPGLPPAFIDFSPFWSPPEFALAIFATWIGPRRGNMAALAHFQHVPHFHQWLIRAALRMLLVISESGNFADWPTSPEKRAAELVLDYVASP